jgi:putative Mg2+ transporter-C (MgtC) family protein
MTMETWLQEGLWVLQLLVATLCGIIIGFERTARYKEAGIRTHAIVALGAALLMLISKYGFPENGETDSARIAAQIVSGIGFLGAGMILVRRNTVSGLTTAAGIWTTSAVGMAIGAGMFTLGIATTLIVVGIQIVFHSTWFQRYDKPSDPMTFLMDIADPQPILRFIKMQDVEITSYRVRDDESGRYELELYLRFPPGLSKQELRERLIAKQLLGEGDPVS